VGDSGRKVLTQTNGKPDLYLERGITLALSGDTHMAIKFSKKLLEQIVLEELVLHLREQLHEAKPGRGTVLDDEDPQEELPGEDDQIPNPGMAPEEDLPSTSAAPEAGDDPGEPADLPAGEEEADVDLDALEAGEEPPSEEEEGTVAGEVSGKTIEDITMDDDSKIMPGATEIVLTFRESPDAFRFLITKTGQIKYFFRGLHNDLDAPVSPMPADDAPDEEMPGEEGGEEGLPPQDGEGGEETEEMPPLGDEDMPPEEEPPLEEPTSSRK
jgi:hypothetical protein